MSYINKAILWRSCINKSYYSTNNLAKILWLIRCVLDLFPSRNIDAANRRALNANAEKTKKRDKTAMDKGATVLYD